MCDRGLPPALAPGLISRPTRSRKLSEFPNNPLVREASVCDLRGSSVFEQAPNLLGKSRRAGEGEEGGLGLCPEWGRLLLVALIAEACSLRLAGFGCLAVNKKKKKKLDSPRAFIPMSRSLVVSRGGAEGEEGFC